MNDKNKELKKKEQEIQEIKSLERDLQ